MDRLISLAVITILWIAGLVPSTLYARDDGRFTNSPLKEWFDRLASRNGLCCAFADGVSVQDVDWDSQEGHYRVRIYGQWFVVADVTVVIVPYDGRAETVGFGYNRGVGHHKPLPVNSYTIVALL